MDYKGLIEQLRSASRLQGTWLRNRMVEAAAAIETLLAERDAAMADVQKNCNTCCWWHDGGCCAPLELYGGCDFSVRQAWKWHGSQKQQ